METELKAKFRKLLFYKKVLARFCGFEKYEDEKIGAVALLTGLKENDIVVDILLFKSPGNAKAPLNSTSTGLLTK
ncbi:hypothetical protein [Methanoregula sp.]|jgi:hypothetical protein|uniref:hypothetical protein n=1 Tax=Methanoregula sp. TaxID=2052170 RepID=UPI003C27A061